VSFAAITLCVASQHVFIVVVVVVVDFVIDSVRKLLDTTPYTCTPPCIFMTWCLVKHSIRLHGAILS